MFPAQSPPPPTAHNIILGYAIAIALGAVVLFSTVLIISFVCFRFAAAVAFGRGPQPENRGGGENVVPVPSRVFIVSGDESPQNDAVGLEASVIASYPKLVFTKCSGGDRNDVVCSICLGEYVESEVLRMLPECMHRFHAAWAEAWLARSASCPVCRSSPLPTVATSPLQAAAPVSEGLGR